MTSTRRRVPMLLAAGAAALALAGCGAGSAEQTPAADVPPSPDASTQLRSLEREFDARVGVAATDTGDGTTVTFRSRERFGYASTYKALLAAHLLDRTTPAERRERLTWTRDDVASAGHAPVASRHVDDGLTLQELAEAAVRESDNAAANLVLDHLGGPAHLQAFLARLGDTTTRVVNHEPDLNTIEPGSTDDTTTPAAFTAALGRLLDGSVLSRPDRAALIDWMSNNATGDTLIRAGAPQGWDVADKSGGAAGIRNDIAVVTPPGREPVVLTILTARNDPGAAYDDALVARVAAVVLQALA
ncbi:class A beta-lactamase [Aeromicrobium wangtongii]|uniref:Beta-lactamase n=1 Tax=Aeromicrobium wangtongii TaxID=2969247 RepID=A0ABY5MCI3_9ACTN|nr:class A beta-lactamase [Aeromicrobium wangtongii]MCD9196859.1 class A beta-lactamase [Aeromicrobium wangtongii]UUP14368.1 class A beta-lactamase [Aeromicrobium wangtongii]